MTDPGTCPRCSTPIVFAALDCGKRVAFEPDDDGEWVIAQGAASHQGKAPWREHQAPAIPRYTRHLDRCSASPRGRR